MLPLLLIGAKVIISWNPNSEPDLMGYRVYFGNAPRSYHTVIDVGKVTRYEIDAFTRDGRYFFAVTAYDSAGNESNYSEEVSTYIQVSPPAKDTTAALQQFSAYNFPNPFKPETEVTNIRYYLPEAATVTLKIYNVANELIRILIDGREKPAGEHLDTFWDGRDQSGKMMPNGVYFATLQAGVYRKVIKIVIAR